jgi:SpoIID/LytB domain protein
MWGYDAYMAAVPDPGLPARASPLSPAELDLWLRATPSTYSSVPQFYFPASYRWEKWVRPAEIARRLKAGGRGDVGEIKRIVTRGRGISGRVVKVEVAGSEGSIFVSGDAIWNSMGALRSSLFTIDYQFDKFGKLEYIVFRGAGHGHGIGMDQHGAAGMASLGFKAEDILKLYYPLAGLLQL